MTTPDPTHAPLEIPSISQIEFLKERYSDFEKIGSGGMGTVFKAYDNVLAIHVAIKVLNYETLSGIQVMRFQQEAKAASKFSHPSLISILDFGAGPEGQLYLVMEYIEGQSLLDYIDENGPIYDKQLFFDIFISLARAIAYIHSFDVVHRDIKPSNIMLLEDGAIKVIDFGIAKLDSQDESQSLTATGIAIGSPAYMSPEQVRGVDIDARSDIYSFGCLIYKALVGEPVFKAESLMEVMSRQVDFELPKLTANSHQDFASSVEPIFEKLTFKDPGERFQNFDSVIEALSIASEVSQSVAVEAVDEVEKKSRPGSGIERSHILLVTLALLIAGVATIFYFFINDTKTKSQTLVDESDFKPAIVDFTAEKAGPPFKKKMIHGIVSWTFTDVETLKDEDFKWLKEKLSKAREEAIYLNETKIDGSGFKYIADRNIVSIICANTNISNESMKQIAAFKNLEVLKVASTKVSDLGISFLKSKKLVSLDLNGCVAITNSGIKMIISNCPELRHLRIGGTKITPEIFSDLRRLKNLQEVDLLDLNLKDEDLLPLVKIKTLSDYDLSTNRRLTNRSLEILSRAHNLSSLNITGCKLITEKGRKLIVKKHPAVKIEDKNADINNAAQGLKSLLEIGKDSMPDYSF